MDAHGDERAVWESEVAEKDKEIGALKAKVDGLKGEQLGWEAERAARQTGGVGSPEKKPGEGAKKQVGSLAEAKLRTDLKKKEDARAALEKKVTDLDRDLKAAKADLHSWEKLEGGAEQELKQRVVKLMKRIQELEEENTANAAEFKGAMRERRDKHERVAADLEQQAAAALEQLKETRAELYSVEMEREQLSLQLLSLQRMLSGDNRQATAAASASFSKPAKLARSLDVRPGPSSPPSASGTPPSVLESKSPGPGKRPKSPSRPT
eukprot:TRINITY_DN3985_c0_g2_i1.p2 TRINITY_DN3985_c0_g2~~TRINITY_DN3985_c0_g2_i1.p2  ORF type:complete len:266 (-),score=81.78 TRINITY_DN3985_c0_g2_i1:377-1174(-)